MKKRWIYLLTALTLAAGMCIAEPMSGVAAPLEADEQGYVAGSCSLTVYPEDPNKEEAMRFGEDLEEAGVVVDLYLVARAVKSPGYDTYHYEPVGGYASVQLPDGGEGGAGERPAANWEDAAQQAAAIALNETSPGTPVGGSGKPAGQRIENLTPGLYLLVARGSGLTNLEEYKKEIEQKGSQAGDTENETGEGTEAPTGKQKRIVTIANSKRYTYAFLPQLISLPTREADDEGIISTANPGDWIFDASVHMKPERLDRYGSLKIVKTLSEYETMGGVQEPATFVFEVTGTLDGQVVYSNVDSITFTSAGQESVVLNRIPSGATVTVKEVYTGSSYQLTVPGEKTADIAADEVASVAFENEYDGRRTNGHGIKNQFVYDQEKGAWGWYSNPAQDANGNLGEPPVVENPGEPPAED